MRSLTILLLGTALYFSFAVLAQTGVAMLTLLAIVGYGFHTALAGRPIFKDELLEG